MPLDPGNAVRFFDPWLGQFKAGVIVDVRRSAKNPWFVAVVRLKDGGEVEVHPDRVEEVGAGKR